MSNNFCHQNTLLFSLINKKFVRQTFTAIQKSAGKLSVYKNRKKPSLQTTLRQGKSTEIERVNETGGRRQSCRGEATSGQGGVGFTADRANFKFGACRFGNTVF